MKRIALLLLGCLTVSSATYAGHCCSDYDDERSYPDSNYYRDGSSIYYDNNDLGFRVDNSEYYRPIPHHHSGGVYYEPENCDSCNTCDNR
jgi:hypothetical protein